VECGREEFAKELVVEEGDCEADGKCVAKSDADKDLTVGKNASRTIVC